MAASIQQQHPTANVVTRPGPRGQFLVTVDGRVIWDKKGQHNDRFPEPDEILRQLSA